MYDRRRFRFVALGLVILSLGPWPPALAQSPTIPHAERLKIEALIRTVEQLGEATFIRNGRAYDAAAAARFLRGKLQAREAEVRSAEDFIAKVASFSSTTGKPYLIRFRDGSEQSSERFLREQLARIEGKHE